MNNEIIMFTVDIARKKMIDFRTTFSRILRRSTPAALLARRQ